MPTTRQGRLDLRRSAKRLSMGNLKNKTEGGHRRGHSNMDHWVRTDEIKEATRKRRRAETKKIVRQETAEGTDSSGAPTGR